MISILSLPNGNAINVLRACTRLGIPAQLAKTDDDLKESDGLIFPGVGAAAPAMQYLQGMSLTSDCGKPRRTQSDRDKTKKLDQIICSYKKPFLGICLGMQLLFDSSEEGQTDCLGIISGTVRKLPSSVITPHMGWNMIRSNIPCISFARPQDDNYAYFVHSYVCVPDDLSVITMTTSYGTNICVGVQKDNFFGVQWHPEKSGAVGDRYILSFSQLCKARRSSSLSQS